MPRTALPPTPASSTDIHGKDGTKQLSHLQMTFELPEPAMVARPANNSDDNVGGNMITTPASPVSTASPKTPYRIQPSEAVKSRRRSSAAAATAAAKGETPSFALPPPPTRSRKIIQMKPRPQSEKKPVPAQAATLSNGKGAGKKATAAALTAAPAPASSGDAGAGVSKKKQPSATSAAGRKIARKTAHSLIERRRRSKMNEEFATLKDMIPACTGEMHKLAILQASIEYVRYLQDCVEKLKAQREPTGSTEMEGMTNTNAYGPYNPEPQFQPRRRSFPEGEEDEEEEEEQEHHSPDVEMTGSDAGLSPTFATQPSSSTTHSHQPSVSPALAAQDASSVRRHDSFVPAAEHYRHYSYSAVTSPAIGPGWGGGGGYAPSNHSAAGSTLTSPALGPLRERDLDQEATAALLMLNSDRRGTIGSGSGRGSGSGGSGRGMSVKDLLSS